MDEEDDERIIIIDPVSPPLAGGNCLLAPEALELTQDHEGSPEELLKVYNDIWRRLGELPDGEIFEHSVSEEELVETLNYAKAWWLAPAPAKSRDAVAAYRFRDSKVESTLLEPLTSGTLSGAMIEAAYKREVMRCTRLELAMRKSKIIERKCDVGSSFLSDLQRMAQAVGVARRVLHTYLDFSRVYDPAYNNAAPSTHIMFADSYFSEDMLTKTKERALVYTLQCLLSKGLRRYNKACYEMVWSETRVWPGDTIARSYPTRAWRRACDIEAFVLSSQQSNKYTHLKEWQDLTDGQNVSYVIDRLLRGDEMEFPQLVPQRNWHAFANGLYNTEELVFHPWCSEMVGVPQGTVACAFHACDFDVESILKPWRTISTPYFDSVLKYQLEGYSMVLRDGTQGKLSFSNSPNPDLRGETVMEWMHALFGRVLFEVNAKDTWQVMPFFMGYAGTGKSVLIKTASSFFDKEDVEVLSNAGRKGDGGLSTFIEKKLWVVYEAKGDFALDQAQLQSMISGEPTAITVLYGETQQLRDGWLVPGLMAGNNFPRWKDESGSMQRRILVIRCRRKVEASDPQLASRIKGEMGRLFHKCCAAYMSMVKKYGTCDIWGTHNDAPVVPWYFHYNKEELKQATNPFEDFLNTCDTLVQTNNDSGMPLKRFQEIVREYTKSRGLSELKFSGEDKDKISIALRERGCFIVDGGLVEAVTYGGSTFKKGTKWLQGFVEKIHYIEPPIAMGAAEEGAMYDFE